MFKEMLLLQLKIFLMSVLKQHVILLYNGCNLEFCMDCSKWEITWRKSILNPQIVADFVKRCENNFTFFSSPVKKNNHCGANWVSTFMERLKKKGFFNVSNIIFGKFSLSSYNKVINFYYSSCQAIYFYFLIAK